MAGDPLAFAATSLSLAAEEPDTGRICDTKRFAFMYETAFGLNPYVSYSESFEPILGATHRQAR